MRSCGFGTQLRTPDLDDDNGFTTFGREFGYFDEFFRVLETFYESSDDLSVIVVKQIAYKI